MPVRAGWVPCVGFQPPKPMVMMIDEADAIAEECERAFQRCRSTTEASAPAKRIPPPPPPQQPGRPGSGSEAVEEEPTQRTPTKPAMKLLMNPKGVQDFHAVQEHYQALMNAAPPSPEVGKIVTEVQSPTGKGAELFAKRKKRMDKFIVDETTVQKAQQQTTTITQQSFSSQSNVSSSSTSSFSSKKQAEYERNQQQEQILMSSPHIGGPTVAPGTGAIYTAEVKVVQRASLPPTPVVDVPHHSLLELSSEDKSDKRRSLSFNLAAKGWGTYNKFYTPITFAT